MICLRNKIRIQGEEGLLQQSRWHRRAEPLPVGINSEVKEKQYFVLTGHSSPTR